MNEDERSRIRCLYKELPSDMKEILVQELVKIERKGNSFEKCISAWEEDLEDIKDIEEALREII